MIRNPITKLLIIIKTNKSEKIVEVIPCGYPNLEEQTRDFTPIIFIQNCFQTSCRGEWHSPCARFTVRIKPILSHNKPCEQ